MVNTFKRTLWFANIIPWNESHCNVLSLVWQSVCFCSSDDQVGDMSGGAGRAGLSGDRGLQPAGHPGSTGCSHSWARGGEEMDHLDGLILSTVFYFSALHAAAHMQKAILWSSWDTLKWKPFIELPLLPFCPDRLPDQNSSAGARTRLHLPGSEGRVSADHAVWWLH